MKKILLLLSAVFCFVSLTIAQDTIYLKKKGLPLIKFPSATVDSFSVKKPRVIGADTLILYSKISLPIKIAVLEIDSITFIKPNINFASPTVATIGSSSITQTSAVINGNIVLDGGAFILEKGFVYGTSPNPTISNSKITNTGLSSTFLTTINNLLPNTTYHFRSYAVNSVGIGYGSSLSFTTLPSTIATLTTTKPVSLGNNKFTCGGTITSDGGSPITSRGVFYSSVFFSDTTFARKLSGTGSGSFVTNIDDVLEPNKLIYFKAFARNANGIALGNIDSLLTPITLGFVKQYIDLEFFDINNNNFSATLDVYTGGINPPIEGVTHGFCVSKSPIPTISNSDTVVTYSTNQTYSSNFVYMSGVLKGNTKYYFRSFVLNPVGIAYSNIDSIKTQNVSPILKILSQSKVKDTCFVEFSIENDGGKPITSLKYFYGTFPVEAFMTAVNLSTGSTTYKIKQLVSTPSSQTLYFFVSAVNAIGETKQLLFFAGTPVGFATFGGAGNSYGVNEFTFFQTITGDGGSPITQRGLIFGTDPEPTELNSTVLTDGSGTGRISKLLQGLAGGTKYYIKAYAKNGAGTAYSSVYSVTTLPLSVVTGITSNLTSNSISIEGEITNDGGKTITESGIVYSTTQNPTVLNSKVISTSQSTFIVNIFFTLSSGTTYYARTYAINENGLAYGNQITFTTLPSLSTVEITNTASNISKTSASVTGNVTNAGGGTITERGFVYSTTKNKPTTSDIKITSGTGLGIFNSTITGLTAGTNYYVRSYAVNAAGTSYSNDGILFRTLANLAKLGTTSTSSVGSTSVVVFGEVVNDGGDGASEFGFVYGTSWDPTITNGSKVSYTSGLAGPIFSSPITNLTPQTIYYIRSYFTNNAGTAYSPNVTVITLP
jgi:hypothetical protein